MKNQRDNKVTQYKQKTGYSILYIDSPKKQQGYSLVELSLAMIIAALIILGINSTLNTALQAKQTSQAQNNTLQQARFAMQQMVRAVSGTRRLLLPLGENPATAWSESVRDVLAVTLDPTLDRDKDGWADANNDEDFLDINNDTIRDSGEPERIDEDLPADATNDGQDGIIGIDDDNDGSVDETSSNDDDEDGVSLEDLTNGLDDDNDGSIDEDTDADMNQDGFAGSGGTGNNKDDDEDGQMDEDWLDPVVFFLNGTTLIQRIPNINPVDGTDYSEYTIVENVSLLRIERISGNDGSTVLVDISLTLSPPGADAISLNTRIRAGAGL